MANIRDVANLAGVSLSTVSIVINGNTEKRSISKKTEEKVLAAMKQLEYVPNSNAKRLRSGSEDVYTIALFWSFDFRRVMMPRFLSGLTGAIKEKGTNTTVTVYPYTPGELYKQDKLLSGDSFVAAIIANAEDEDIDYLSGKTFQKRIVLYNRQSEQYGSVNVDNEAIGRIAAAHLFEQGYRRPHVIYATKNFSGANKREIAFNNEFAARGVQMTKHDFSESENSVDGGVACAKALLKRHENGEALPDSFFCASDAIAIGFANVMTQHGIRIPEEMGIIAIGNGEPQYSRCNNPSITVVDIPMERMAAAAYEMFNNARYSVDFKKTTDYFETQLIRRRSTDRLTENQEET